MEDDWSGILKVVRRTSPRGIPENLVLDTKQSLPLHFLSRKSSGKRREVEVQNLRKRLWITRAFYPGAKVQRAQREWCPWGTGRQWKTAGRKFQGAVMLVSSSVKATGSMCRDHVCGEGMSPLGWAALRDPNGWDTGLSSHEQLVVTGLSGCSRPQ